MDLDAFAVDPEGLARGERSPVDDATQTGLESLARGRSVVLYTALGPETDVGAELEDESARHAIGRALGQIERALVAQARLRRAVIAGGDTSSHALRELGVYALTTLLPLPATPGSPLCLAHSDDPAFDGLEIALKGGQVGGDDYFDKMRLGRVDLTPRAEAILTLCRGQGGSVVLQRIAHAKAARFSSRGGPAIGMADLSSHCLATGGLRARTHA